jgi:GntR family transcriptional regulator
VSFTQLMAGCGLAAYSRVLSARIVDDEREVCARLRLPATTKLVRVRRLRIGGGEPFALETCYLPAREFSGITEAALERRSLFDILRRDYGLELSYADDEVDATSSDPRTAELLKVPPGAPILRLRQLLYSKSGAPVVYSLGLYRSDRHTVMVRRFA